VGDAEIEAARAFRRWSFTSIGGFNEVIQAGGEDWELSERLRNNGSHVGRINVYIVHDEGKLSLRDDLRKKFHYGAGLRRYARLAPGRALRKIVRRAFARLVRVIPVDPLHASGLIVMKALELCAVVAGMGVSMYRTLLRRPMR
jgi:GT2 family glycosyltransferase